METHIHFHARIFVIVERADCHAVAVDMDAVHLAACRVVTLPFTASNTFIASSFRETKKALDIFVRENGKCLLEFHILFFLFVLRRFLLRLFLVLLLQELHFLCKRVLRFGLLLDLCLFRREDFTNPITNIFHRL